MELPKVSDSIELPSESPSPGVPVVEQIEHVVDIPTAQPEPDGLAPQLSAGDVWRRSVTSGQPLTGEQLGAQFGESPLWGWDRIAEVVHGEQNPREFARDLWRASMAAGRPLTGRELGEW